MEYSSDFVSKQNKYFVCTEVTNLQHGRRRQKQWCHHRAMSSLHEEGRKPVSSCLPSSDPEAGCCGPSARRSSHVCGGNELGSILLFGDNNPKDKINIYFENEHHPWLFSNNLSTNEKYSFLLFFLSVSSPAVWCHTKSWSTLPGSLTWGQWLTCSLRSAGWGFLGWWGCYLCPRTDQ